MRSYERIGVDWFLFGSPRVYIKMNLATGSWNLYMENGDGPERVGTFKTAVACKMVADCLLGIDNG